MSRAVIGNAGNVFGMEARTLFGPGVVVGAVVTVLSTSCFSLDKSIGSPAFSRLYLMMLATATLYSPLRIICLFNRVVKLAALLFAKALRLASLYTVT